MVSISRLQSHALTAATFVAGTCFSAAALAAPPTVVTAPNSDPGCFAPWASSSRPIGFAERQQ